MDLKELKEILQILEEKEITEFELEEEGMKLRIRKASAVSSNHAAASRAAGPGVHVPDGGASARRRRHPLPAPPAAAAPAAEDAACSS